MRPREPTIRPHVDGTEGGTHRSSAAIPHGVLFNTRLAATVWFESGHGQTGHHPRALLRPRVRVRHHRRGRPGSRRSGVPRLCPRRHRDGDVVVGVVAVHLGCQCHRPRTPAGSSRHPRCDGRGADHCAVGAHCLRRGGLWLAVGYAVLRGLGLWKYWVGTGDDAGTRQALLPFIRWSSLGPAVMILGAFFDPPARSII